MFVLIVGLLIGGYWLLYDGVERLAGAKFTFGGGKVGADLLGAAKGLSVGLTGMP